MKKKRRRTRKKKPQKKKIISAILFLVVVGTLLVFFSKEKGHVVEELNVDNISFVRGVDVSRYQGDIDFKALYDQSIRFSFIKATEGIEYLDPKYVDNFKNSKEAGLKTGAYHFYRFETSGEDQAKYFIRNVNLEAGDLPPVIDLEYYGQYTKNPMSPNTVIPELRKMVDIFRDHYKKTPIIYTNKYVYNHYLKDNFEDVDFWYREIGTDFAYMPNEEKWTFWQYDDMAELEGYGGPGASKYIDLNYFYGDLDDLEEYGRNNS